MQKSLHSVIALRGCVVSDQISQHWISESYLVIDKREKLPEGADSQIELANRRKIVARL
jgi:hypothetical protein